MNTKLLDFFNNNKNRDFCCCSIGMWGVNPEDLIGLVGAVKDRN